MKDIDQSGGAGVTVAPGEQAMKKVRKDSQMESGRYYRNSRHHTVVPCRL